MKTKGRQQGGSTVLDDLSSQMEALDDGFLEEENEDEQHQEPQRQAKTRGVFKFGDQEIPAEKVNDFVSTKLSEIDKQSEDIKKMREGILKAVGGGSNNEDEKFDELKFLSDPQYRADYLAKEIEKKTSQKQKEIEEKLSLHDRKVGEMKYNEIKRDVIQDLDNMGIPFDFKKNEKKIESIVMNKFRPEFVRDNPKKAILYAVNEIIGGKMKSVNDDISIEAPSGYMAGGKKKTADDEIKERILKAKAPGEEDGVRDSVFV